MDESNPDYGPRPLAPVAPKPSVFTSLTSETRSHGIYHIYPRMMSKGLFRPFLVGTFNRNFGNMRVNDIFDTSRTRSRLLL